MRYPINEIFETLQGEGSYTGTPSVFVRLMGCPVGCPWCDTKHTWHQRDTARSSLAFVLQKTRDGDTWCELSLSALVDVVMALDAGHVVLTGGEPCIHDLVPLTRRLFELGRTVQLETSGTHEIRVAPSTFVTLSPKLDMPGGFKLRMDACMRADEIKHPIGKRADYDALRAHVLPHARPGVPVYLQPLSLNTHATATCIDIATRNGHRVSIQTHKLIGIR